eukprot:Nk52_evm9s256 gene=Nk52_evmTU9s256
MTDSRTPEAEAEGATMAYGSVSKENGKQSSNQASPELSVQMEKASPVIMGNSEYYFSKRPLIYQVLAVACVCMIAFGSHYTHHMLTSLKKVLKEEMQISNAEYGVVQSASSLVNTVLPLLGGLFIDRFGLGVSSLTAGTLVTLGQIVVSMAVSINSFPLMVVGRILYGFGSGTLVVSQEAMLSKWFRGRALAFSLALQVMMARLSSLLAVASAAPLMKATGSYTFPFHFSSLVCCVSLLMNAICFKILKSLKKAEKKARKEKKRKEKMAKEEGCVEETAPLTPEDNEGMQSSENEPLLGQKLKCCSKSKKYELRESFTRSLGRFVVEEKPIFFATVLAGISFHACVISFLHISTNLIQTKFHTSASIAGLKAASGLILPVVIAPAVGMTYDRFGKRTFSLCLASLLMAACCYTLGFTYLTPFLGMALYSIGFSIGPLAYISSIPLVLVNYENSLGIAFGLSKCLMHVSVTLSDPIVGLLQDRSKDDSYDHSVQFLLCVALVGFASALVVTIYDQCIGTGIMNANFDVRNELIFAKGMNLMNVKRNSKAIMLVNIAFICLFLCMFVSSWVHFGMVFFKGIH